MTKFLHSGQDLSRRPGSSQGEAPEDLSSGALDEVVADGCEMMLRRTRVMQTMAQENKGLFKTVKDWIQKWTKTIRDAFRGVSEVHEEARAVAEMETERLEKLVELWDQGLIEASERAQKSPAKEGGAVKYQAREIDKYYERQIDQWDGKDHGGAFRVGKVSDPLLKIGIPDIDIWFDQSKAAKQLTGKEEITKTELKQIPHVLANPIVISESYDKTIMVFGQIHDARGNPIVIAVRVDSTNRRNKISVVNKIRSIGTRNHDLNSLLSEERILYLGENKKETKAWFNALGRSTPFGGTKFGLIKSISFDPEKSNTKFQERDALPDDRELLMAAEAKGKNAERPTRRR